jgi:hypothetical protein
MALKNIPSYLGVWKPPWEILCSTACDCILEFCISLWKCIILGTSTEISTNVLFLGWDKTESLGTQATSGPTIPEPDNRWGKWRIWWNEKWKGKSKYSDKTCPSTTLSITDPTQTDLWWNPAVTLRNQYQTPWAKARPLSRYEHHYFFLLYIWHNYSSFIFHCKFMNFNACCIQSSNNVKLLKTSMKNGVLYS